MFLFYLIHSIVMLFLPSLLTRYYDFSCFEILQLSRLTGTGKILFLNLLLNHWRSVAHCDNEIGRHYRATRLISTQLLRSELEPHGGFSHHVVGHSWCCDCRLLKQHALQVVRGYVGAFGYQILLSGLRLDQLLNRHRIIEVISHISWALLKLLFDSTLLICLLLR